MVDQRIRPLIFRRSSANHATALLLSGQRTDADFGNARFEPIQAEAAASDRARYPLHAAQAIPGSEVQHRRIWLSLPNGAVIPPFPEMTENRYRTVIWSGTNADHTRGNRTVRGGFGSGLVPGFRLCYSAGAERIADRTSGNRRFWRRRLRAENVTVNTDARRANQGTAVDADRGDPSRSLGPWKGVLMKTQDTEKRELRVHIRWMIRRDMPEVLQIEQESFGYPWCEEDFLRCLRQRNCIGMVAELNEKVVGFMIYELHKSKLHILNFAVHPESRRRRIGSQMIQKLIGKLSSHRRNRITLEVRETNLASQLFFRDARFRAIRVLRAFYEDTSEDAYLMQHRLSVAAESEGVVDRIAQLEH